MFSERYPTAKPWDSVPKFLREALLSVAVVGERARVIGDLGDYRPA